MKKIILIEDNQRDFDLILQALNSMDMDIEIYPNNEEDFCNHRKLLRISIGKYFREDIRKKQEKIFKDMIVNFENMDSNTIYIIDFQLDPSNEESRRSSTGIAFYNKFIPENGRKVIFVSATTLTEEKELITQFCQKHKDCFFIEKWPPNVFVERLKEMIKKF